MNGTKLHLADFIISNLKLRDTCEGAFLKVEDVFLNGEGECDIALMYRFVVFSSHCLK